MKSKKGRKANPHRMAYRHKIGLVLMAFTIQWCAVAVIDDAWRHRQGTKGGPVALWREKPKETDLAVLTPGCDLHDWGCVVAAGGKGR